MPHQDAEVTDVVVVLVDEPGMTTADAAKKLEGVGLLVSTVNEEEGVVEGSINSSGVGGLKKFEFVKYVRSVFTYTADYPVGDPRNLDADDDELPSEADDAGA